jgi:hypothetical protein
VEIEYRGNVRHTISVVERAPIDCRDSGTRH